MTVPDTLDFAPYAPSVPFERLAGPYQMAKDGSELVLGLQTQMHHAGVHGQAHPAAIMAFGDFALYALINHHSGGAYANRIPSDEETIVTLTVDVELLGPVPVGEMLIARGEVFRESKRLVGARTIISTVDGRQVARMGGLWSRTIMPARKDIAPLISAALPAHCAASFRSHLGADTLPMMVLPQHCNDLAISHGGCLLAITTFAIEDALMRHGRPRQLVSFHGDFLAPGRSGQCLDVNITLTNGRTHLVHADGAIKVGATALMQFHAIG